MNTAKTIYMWFLILLVTAFAVKIFGFYGPKAVKAFIPPASATLGTILSKYSLTKIGHTIISAVSAFQKHKDIQKLKILRRLRSHLLGLHSCDMEFRIFEHKNKKLPT